jgi:hypothetical protein
MRRLMRASVCVLPFLLSGCLIASKEVVENSPNPAFKELSIALLLSSNSTDPDIHAPKPERRPRSYPVPRLFVSRRSDPQKASEAFSAMKDSFQEDFRAVSTVSSVDEARAGGADFVLVLDLDPFFSRHLVQTSVIDVRATALTLEKKPIDVLDVQGFQDPNPTAAYPNLTQDASTELAVRRLLSALHGSDKFGAFAQKRAAERRNEAAAPRQAAVPAASVSAYHSDVDAPGYKSGENPDAFALVIGIEKYPDLPAAEFAERDAAAVQRHLVALGYPERNILTLTGSQAGRAGIEKYVETWLPRNVGENSTVFVYFSGHGAPDTRTGQAYLVPWDGDAKFLENTGYPVKRLYENLNALKARQVIVAMDACFSGAGGRSVLAKGARPLVTKVDTAAGAAGKLVVLTAAGGEEITGTDGTQGHGLFTYYLLKGLGGEAKDKQGKVTVKGLYDYLKPNVQDAARRQNRDQTPELIGSQAEQVVLRSE